MNAEYPDTAKNLFDYLKDSLYSPTKAEIDLNTVDPEFIKVAQGIELLDTWMIEQDDFGKKLSKGELDTPAPAIENRVAAPLKMLQGTLTHLAWQAGEVAKGDYSQHVDFMGDLADAFNTMVKQLEERKHALEEERDALARLNSELASTHSLMMSLVFDSKHGIVVYDRDTMLPLYASESLSEFEAKNPQIVEGLRAYLRMFKYDPDADPTKGTQWTQTVSIPEDEVGESGLHIMQFVISTHAITWAGCPAIAHLISDDTDNMIVKQEMEEMAFHDPLTGTFNRRYGMGYANDLMLQHAPFSLAFIDLDNLKYCNDDFGHNEGDAYIHTLVRILKEIPNNPTICRIGGDEFMLIFSNFTGEKLEEELMNRRSELMATPLPEGYGYYRSFSFGIVNIPKSPNKPLSEYLSEADRKMYEFKYSHKKLLKINKESR